MSDRGHRLVQAAKARVGQQLPGAWTLERLIGLGGAAAVYQASRGPTQAAVKVIHAEYIGHETIEARFRREAELGATLRHPNLPSILGMGQAPDGELFLIMELLEGKTVEQLMRAQAQGALPVEQALDITQQALLALERCHAQGVIHRDLKPANLFLTHQGLLKVLDFGVARQEQSDAGLTREGTALGTPAFMPPEQARGRLDMLDARSDLFALGATLYTMLTGSRLHEASTAEESLVLAATRPAESIARVMPQLPAPLIALVDRALAWNPSRRFESAAAMLDALRQADLMGDQELSHRPDELRVELAQAMLQGEPSQAQDDAQDDAQAQPEVDRALLKAIEHAFGLAERYMAAIRQYGAEHVETRRHQESAYQAMVEVLARASTGALTLRVLPHSLELDGEVVWEPTPPFDQVPYHLFSSGLRRLTLLSGVDRHEYLELLRIFQLDPQRDLAPEDDLSTVLWQKELPHLQLQLVSTFQLDDARDQEDFVQACAQERERVALMQPEALLRELEQVRMLLGTSPSALAEARGLAAQHQGLHEDSQAGDLSASPALLATAQPDPDADLQDDPRDDPQRWTSLGVLRAGPRRQLMAALERPALGLDQRLPLILVDALREAQRGGDSEPLWRALGMMMGRLAQSQRELDALLLYGRLMATTREREAALELTRRVMSADVTRRALAAFARWLKTPEEASRARDERALRALKELLSSVDDAYTQEVADLYRVAHQERGLVVLCYGYLRRHLAGHEDVMGQLLAQLSAGHCRKIIEALLELDSPQALQALAYADKNPEDALRLEALELRAQRQPQGAATQVASLASSPDAHLRVRALQVAARHQVTGLAPFLGERVRHSGFSELPYSERRLLLTLLVLDDPRAGARVCLDLLRDHGLVGQDTRSTTRLLAVELLAKVPLSREHLEALEAATKRRPWNSRELQEAAQALLDRHQGSIPR